MLLYQAGPERQELFETLEKKGNDYDTAKEKLNNICRLRKMSTMMYSKSAKLLRCQTRQLSKMQQDLC